jgi:DNA transformation protein and related proteins
MADMTLKNMKNLGAKSAALLHQAGVTTPQQLSALGAVEVFCMVRQIDPNATIVLLYALQGALLDIHWNALPEAMKQDLRRRANIE